VPGDRLQQTVNYLRRQPSLPIVLPSAARFYDRKHDRSFTVNVLMLDTGASGGLLGEHVTRSKGVPWQATPGMTIKGAGSRTYT
jgi:hypothetical protein